MKTINFFSIAVLVICAFIMCSCSKKQMVISQLEKLQSELSLIDPKTTTEADVLELNAELSQIKANYVTIKSECVDVEIDHIEELLSNCERRILKLKTKSEWEETKKDIKQGLHDLIDNL